jgi:predicted permease
VDLLVQILLNNIIPIFLAIGAGVALAHLADVDPSTLSKAVLYVFSPCLVYTLLTDIEFQSDEVVRIVVATVANVTISGALAWAIGRVLGLSRVLTTALMLAAMFTNSGNYGLSLNNLAFGEEALARAAIFFVTNSVLAYTIGIYLASSGRLTAREALKSLLSIPPIYAALLALATAVTGIRLPGPVMTSVRILGSASIPVMLLILGIQIASARRLVNVRLVGLASSLRLVLGPVVALVLVTLLQLSGPARQATVVEASMPTAVMVTVLATEFDIEPAFVTSSVVLSTLLSPITLTLLIAFLS